MTDERIGAPLTGQALVDSLRARIVSLEMELAKARADGYAEGFEKGRQSVFGEEAFDDAAG